LRGEFAFLLYDRSSELFIAARDRFGIKPLYLSRLKDGFVFGSEMKSIFASGLVQPKLNAAGFDPLGGQDPANAQFPFEGIQQVPPASYAMINLRTGDAKVHRYWSAKIPDRVADPIKDGPFGETYARSVLEQLEEAVRLRLRADVPVGLYLSGGIDSAFVAALMKRNLATRLHSFSIAFEGSGRNERAFARRAADVIGTDHHELVVGKAMLWDNLEECLWHSELPFASLAPVGKFLLSREARKYVTVVLTGEGADEVFLGYRRFFADAIRDTRKPGWSRVTRSLQSRRLKLGRFSKAIGKASLHLFARNQRRSIELARHEGSAGRDSERPLINVIQEARIAAMPLDILCFLGDREEMAHSLEARLPFLDHHLYELARDIPVDFKMRRGMEKAVLRRAAKGILPEDLRLRRKSGFMLTSEAVDLFGSDGEAKCRFEAYLTLEKFELAGIFSYRAYRFARILASLPPWRILGLKQLRRSANKAIMYMMQAHMLHDMFVEKPRWDVGDERSPQSECNAPTMPAVVAT
jgi:asparagine synthase (glutamine-hydrolysing)